MDKFMLLLGFFTRIPVKQVTYTEDKWRGAIIYTPLIGVVIGCLLAVMYYVIEPMEDSLLRGFFIFFAYILLTGALHLDGLADTVDGIFSYRSRERMLEIMKDSHIGTFGVLALLLITIGNILLLSHMSIISILIFPIVGRIVAILICYKSTYPREDGFGKIFIEQGKEKHVLIFALLCIVVLAVLLFQLEQLGLIMAMSSACIVAIYINRKIHHTLGGITGDVVGAMIETSQCIFLLLTYLIGGWI